MCAYHILRVHWSPLFAAVCVCVVTCMHECIWLHAHIQVFMNVCTVIQSWTQLMYMGICIHVTIQTDSLKGAVHTEMIISPQVSLLTKHFWNFSTKKHCSILLKNLRSWRLVLKCKNKKNLKWLIAHSSYVLISKSPEKYYYMKQNH